MKTSPKTVLKKIIAGERKNSKTTIEAASVFGERTTTAIIILITKLLKDTVQDTTVLSFTRCERSTMNFFSDRTIQICKLT